MRNRFACVLATAIAGVPGCQGAEAPIPSVPGIHIIDDVARANPLGDAPVLPVEVHRGPRFSMHVVQVADSIARHRHARSDETIWIWRGAGVIQIGEDSRKVRAGMVIHVPRGVAHGFRLTSAEPAVAVSMFTPPLREGDRIPVE